MPVFRLSILTTLTLSSPSSQQPRLPQLQPTSALMRMYVTAPTVPPTLITISAASLTDPHYSLLDRGRVLDRRTLVPAPAVPIPLNPRDDKNKILWCAPGTQTFVTVVLTVTANTRLAAALAIQEALEMASMQLSLTSSTDRATVSSRRGTTNTTLVAEPSSALGTRITISKRTGWWPRRSAR